jgi:hypothetical protein
LNEIDWCLLLHSSAAEIAIAPVVTRELEEQKTLNSSRKLRERATTGLKLLNKYLANPQVRDGGQYGSCGTSQVQISQYLAA